MDTHGAQQFSGVIAALDNPGHIMTGTSNGVAHLFRCAKQNL